MYAVTVQVDGMMWWYGAYESREYAENLAKQLHGEVVVLYHPLYTELGDMHGTEM